MAYRSRPSSCSVRGCANSMRDCSNSNSGQPFISFHTIPKAKEARCHEWLLRMGRPDLWERIAKSTKPLYRSYKICSCHFAEDMFLNFSSKKRRLIWNAMPTLNLGSIDGGEEGANQCKQLMNNINLDPIVMNKTHDSISIQPNYDAVPDVMDREDCNSERRIIGSFVDVEKNLTKQLVTRKEEERTSIGSDKVMQPIGKSFASKIIPLVRRKELLVQSPDVPDTGDTIEPLGTKLNLCFFPEISELEGSGILPKNTSDYKRLNITRSLLELNEKVKNEGWSDSMMEVSFSLFHRYTGEYDFLSRLFSLVPTKELHSWVEDLIIGSGFHCEEFSCLQHKLHGLIDQDRLCSLSFYELPLQKKLFYSKESDSICGLVDYVHLGSARTAATRAMVFVVSGITKEWSQPIGYFLKNNSQLMVPHLISECLEKLAKIELKVKVIVCSPSKANTQVFRDLGALKYCPYFTYNDERVFYMFDPTSLRNILKKTLIEHDIYASGKVCRWKHIKELHEFDLDMANKFRSKAKINVSKISAERIPSSSCFSSATASGILTMGSYTQSMNRSKNNHLKGTSEFIRKISELCLIFNCDMSKRNQRHEIGLTNKDTKSLKLLLEWVKSWKIAGHTESLICQTGWISAIICLLYLREELLCKYNITNLIVSRLHRNSIGDLYASLQKTNQRRSTAVTFHKVYKTYLTSSFMKPIKKQRYPNYLNHFFNNIFDLMSISTGICTKNVYDHHDLDKCDKISLPECNSLAYIACHIVRKLKILLTCKTCLSELMEENKMSYRDPDVSQPNGGETKVRTMVAPHKNLLKIMPKLEVSFLKAFRNMYHMSRVKLRIHQYMYKDVGRSFSDLRLDCEDVEKIILGLFINLGIDHIMSKLSVSKATIHIPHHL